MIARMFILLGCFILVACGGDEQDITCKNCAPTNSLTPVAHVKLIKRVRITQKVELDGSGSKPGVDGDQLTFNWSITQKPKDSKAKLVGDKTPMPYFYPDKPGKYLIQLIVNDGNEDSEPFVLEFTTLESPPIAKAKVLKRVRLKEKLELDGSASKPGQGADKLSYDWTFIQIPANSTARLVRSNSVTPYFYPDKKGLYKIQLVVNDGINDSKPDVIEVTPLNTRPTARAKYNDPVRVSETVLLDATISEDIDDDPLTCQWKMISRPKGSAAVLSNPNAITPSFIADSQGEYIVQLIVNDAQIDSEPFVLYIQVHDNPSAKIMVEEQFPVLQKVQLDGSESRPGVGGGKLTYQWTFKQKPNGSQAAFSDPNSPRPTFVADKPGKYIIMLVVNDGKSNSAPFILEYEPLNSKPVALCDYNRPVYVGQTVQLDASKSNDLDNDPLTFLWTLASKPANSNAALSDTSDPNPTFVTDLPGKYVVQLIVSDGKQDSDRYTLIVKTENTKPVAHAGSDVTLFEGEIVQLDASKSTDADGSPLTYDWTVKEKPNGSRSQISNRNKINPTFTPDVPGIYIIQLVVNDGELDSEPDSLEIKANASVDLEPGTIDLSKLVTDPETLKITGTVNVNLINKGTSPVDGDFLITLFEDANHNNQFDPSSDPIIANHTVSDAPDGKDAINVPVIADGQVSFKDNIIFIMIDPMNTVPERNETNNLSNSSEGTLCKPPRNDFSPKLAWAWTGSSNDFPTSNQVVCTPMIGNLTDDNNDGKIDLKDIPDIVFISFEGSNDEKQGIIRAISGDGSGKEHFSIGPISYNNKHFEAFPNYNPALGDIDNDGLLEILVVVNDQVANKWLAVFENTGALKWISNDYSSSQMMSPASISIADLDANGIAEIVIGHFVISNTGQTLMIGKEDNGLNNSNVADIDLDGQMEIIAGRTAYEANGKVLWHVNELERGFNAIANFDNDDHPEIVMVGRGKIALVQHTGEIIWGPKEIEPGGPFRGEGGPPMIADVDGDGLPEIGVAGTKKLSMFNGNGSILWSADIKDPSSVTSASAFDFDGDGRTEIVYRDSESVKIFNGRNGDILFEDMAGSGTFIEMPVVADVDNDNSAEIIVACNSHVSGNVHGIRVYEDTLDHWVNTRKIWNQHAYVTTNIHEDGRIPKEPINNWEVYNNFRQNQMDNPFGCKDISASYIRFDKTNCPNSVKVTARIGNGGGLHIQKDTRVSFYDGNPTGNGRLITEFALKQPLYPGEWIDLTAEINNITSGTNNIFVFADSNKKLWESNEDNNWAQRSFTCD